MGIEELRTVLATLALYPSFDCDYLDAVYDGRCNQRAIQISVVFSRTFSLVFSLLASCGYPEPLTEVRNRSFLLGNTYIYKWHFCSHLRRFLLQ